MYRKIDTELIIIPPMKLVTVKEYVIDEMVITSPLVGGVHKNIQYCRNCTRNAVDHLKKKRVIHMHLSRWRSTLK